LGVRICTLICYDVRFPVFSRSKGDYDLLIYVASWPAVRSFAWKSLLTARAIENQTYLMGVNRVGDDPKEHYSGDTVILDFLGATIAAADKDVEQTVVAELSMDKLETFRSGFPAYLDADKFEILP
ncbi:MAG: nitrilase-related carbon-nitrogen hydrolase, partial [Mucinivorans sp.]